jgi:hypothetical protein
MTWARAIYEATVLFALLSIPQATWDKVARQQGSVVAVACALSVSLLWPITLGAYLVKGRRRGR